MGNSGRRAVASLGLATLLTLATSCSSGSDASSPTTTAGKGAKTTTTVADTGTTTTVGRGDATTTTAAAADPKKSAYCAFVKTYQGPTVESVLSGDNPTTIGLVGSSLRDRLPDGVPASIRTDLEDAKVAVTAGDLDTAKAKTRSALSASQAYCGLSAGGGGEAATDRDGKPLTNDGAGQIPAKYPTALDPAAGDTIIGSQQTVNNGKDYVTLDALTSRPVTKVVDDLKAQLGAGGYTIVTAEAYTGGPGPDGGKVRATGNGWSVDIDVLTAKAPQGNQTVEYFIKLNQL